MTNDIRSKLLKLAADFRQRAEPQPAGYVGAIPRCCADEIIGCAEDLEEEIANLAAVDPTGQGAEAMSDIPRRVQDMLVSVEWAIDEVCHVLETQPSDVRLTDAVTLLQAARDSISDYVNNSVPVRRQVWSGLMAGFIPAETDRTTTNSGDVGGPVSEQPIIDRTTFSFMRNRQP